MNFRKIDMDTWDRKEYYNWFTTKNRCKINMTMNIDITKLVGIIKEKKLRCYPTFKYIASKVLNASDEFKMNYDEDGNLGIYDVIHPRYTIFHESDKRISILWTEYSDNFKIFYDRFIYDITTYGKKRSMAVKGNFPPNCFDMSSLPWSSFTSFDCPQLMTSFGYHPLLWQVSSLRITANFYCQFLFQFITLLVMYTM